MNVLYLHQHFATRDGSGGTRSWEFSRRLMRLGHDVTMVAQVRRGGGVDQPGRHDLDGMHLILLGGYYTNHLPDWRRMWQFIRVTVQASLLRRLPRPPDVVVASSTPLTIGIPGWILARRHGVPFVFEVRDLWPEAPIQLGVLRNPVLCWLARRLERFLYRRADAVVPLSPGMEAGVLAAGCDPRKVVTIPNASDVDLFSPQKRDRSQLRRWSIEDRFVTVHAGMMGEANGLGYVLRAAKELHDRGEHGPAFLIIGEGITRRRLADQALAWGLDNIVFAGSIPRHQLGSVVSSCDVSMTCFAGYPVLATNSPNKLFDGLAAGLPCIVNSDGWTRRLVEGADAGAYVDVRDPVQLAEAVLRLSQDSDLRERQGANALRLGTRVFSRERLGTRFCAVLEHLAGQARNAHRALPPELRESLLPAGVGPDNDQMAPRRPTSRA